MMNATSVSIVGNDIGSDALKVFALSLCSLSVNVVTTVRNKLELFGGVLTSLSVPCHGRVPVPVVQAA